MLGDKLFGRLDERRVRWLLAGFFALLAVPSAALIGQAYGQLKWEAFRSNQRLAEDLAGRIDAELRAAIAAEESRSFGDYVFLIVEGGAAATFVQRSPLAALPIASALPGALGYFQVDAEGVLTTPLLPAGGADPSIYGVTDDQQAARLALEERVRDVLAQNRLVPRTADERAVTLDFAANDVLVTGSGVPGPPPTAPQRRRRAPPSPAAPGAQAAFDRLASAQRSTLATTETSSAPAVSSPGSAASSPPRIAGAPSELATAAAEQVAVAAEQAAVAPSPTAGIAAPPERQKRTEQALVAEPRPGAPADTEAIDSDAPAPRYRVRTFESELDPFELGLLDTGHMVAFRNAWRDGARYIQGVLLERDPFLTGAIETSYRGSRLGELSDLRIAYRGETLALLRAPGAQSRVARPRGYATDALTGELLHRARLSPPFGDLELAFAVNRLPRAPGAGLLAWMSVALAVLLSGGFWLMHRFAVSQIRLTRQQQDFVSAVSHELKTPLTSIRMYGEMLKAGWADEAKKQTYYDYIHSESERLSRLIDNVLQLARLTRSSQHLDVKHVTVAELFDIVQSKIATQVARAGFELYIANETPAGSAVLVDADAFTQILINLVDNALKFSRGAATKRIEIGARPDGGGRVLFTIRDFGPGIPKAQIKRIFELFYRPANAVTRDTAGTGIGLALVRELAGATGGRVDVRNREPGAEFRVTFASAVAAGDSG